MDSAARNGRELRLGPAVYVCTKPLLVSSGLKMRLALGTVLVKDFSNNGGTTGSLLRNRDFSQKLSGVEITGPGVLRARSHDFRGNILALFGDGVQLSGWSINRWAGGRAVMIAGDHWRVSDLSIGGAPVQSGSGGIRMLGGRDNIVRDCKVRAGDDAFQFVPSASEVDPLYDQSISDSAFIDCTGASSNARLMVAALVRPGVPAGDRVLTAGIDNCRFENVNGSTSQVGALSALNSNSSGAIDGLSVLNCRVGASTTGDQAPLVGSIYLAASSASGIQNTQLDNLILRGQPQSALVVNGYVRDLKVNGCVFERDSGGAKPVAILGGLRTIVENTRFEGRDSGSDVIQVRRLGGPVDPVGVTIGPGCLVRGISPSGVGLLVGASTRSRVVSATFRGDADAAAVRVTRAAVDAVLRDVSADGPVLRD